jgi:hypothetical protein
LWRIPGFQHAGEPRRGFSPAGDIAIHERFHKPPPEQGFPRQWVIDGFHASAALASLLRRRRVRSLFIRSRFLSGQPRRQSPVCKAG